MNISMKTFGEIFFIEGKCNAIALCNLDDNSMYAILADMDTYYSKENIVDFIKYDAIEFRSGLPNDIEHNSVSKKCTDEIINVFSDSNQLKYLKFINDRGFIGIYYSKKKRKLDRYITPKDFARMINTEVLYDWNTKQYNIKKKRSKAVQESAKAFDNTSVKIDSITKIFDSDTNKVNLITSNMDKSDKFNMTAADFWYSIALSKIERKPWRY